MRSFLVVLGLIFIVLKLCSVIAWSWWLVLLPLILFVVLRLIAAGVVGWFIAKYS